VLIQRDEQGKRIEVGYHSKGLNPAERNYDVYDREFLALIRALRFWRHLLEGSPYRIKIYTDHANLTKHREAQKLSGKLSRYISFIARFDFELHHLPGKTNTTADALSRRSDHVPPEGEEPKGIALPDHLFVRRLIKPAAVEETIRRQQKMAMHAKQLVEWANKYDLHQRAGYYWNGSALVAPDPNSVSKVLLEIYHDGPTTGHPGQAKTYQDLRRNYWWPGMHEFVKEYVRGCAVCQANKIITRRNQPHLYPIPPEEDAKPFQTIAIDLIVKLPESKGYDTILTITDHDCTKGVILVPCRETMGAEDLAKEYRDRVFPFVGIPSKIISDRDTRFTSHFAKEVCAQLEIKQNISTAYHPQTDGQSEKTNQHVETALRIFCNHQQNDWAEFLPMVQYMLNARVSETTKKAPFELWMGYIPRAHQPERASALPRIEWHEERFKEARRQAQEAMKTAQHLWSQEGTFQPYQKDDQVWLEAKNLKTTHPTTKLRPLRYGPFRITEVISPVAYRLALPPQWKIHNAFHASLLTRYKETGAHGPNYPGQVPDIVEGQEEYEVEKILASSYKGRGRNRKLHLLIKWKGYPDAENTWEPIEGVFAPQLIEEFYTNNPTAIKRIELHPPVAYLRTLQNDPHSAEENVAAFSLLSLSQLPPQEPPAMPRTQSTIPTLPEPPEGGNHGEGQGGSSREQRRLSEEARTALTLPADQPRNRPEAIRRMFEEWEGQPQKKPRGERGRTLGPISPTSSAPSSRIIGSACGMPRTPLTRSSQERQQSEGGRERKSEQGAQRPQEQQARQEIPSRSSPPLARLLQECTQAPHGWSTRGEGAASSSATRRGDNEKRGTCASTLSSKSRLSPAPWVKDTHKTAPPLRYPLLRHVPPAPRRR
jgi:hypothetical protein